MDTKFVDEIYIDNDVLIKGLIDEYDDMWFDIDYAVKKMHNSRILIINNKPICLDFKENVVLPQYNQFKTFRSKELNEIRSYYGSGIDWNPMTQKEFDKYLSNNGSYFISSDGRLKFSNSNISTLTFKVNKDEEVAYEALTSILSIAAGISTNIGGRKSALEDMKKSMTNANADLSPEKEFVTINILGNNSREELGIMPVYSHVGLNLGTLTTNQLIELFLMEKWIPKGVDEKTFEMFAVIQEHLKDCEGNDLREKIKANPDLVEQIEGVLHVDTDMIKKMLLEGDKERAAHQAYHNRILYDTNAGHWELWDGTTKEANTKVKLSEKLVARDPASSVVNGVVGIDFGTKSTVVVYQKDSEHTLPMRIGIEDLTKPVKAKHYENPTFMEFIDFESFYDDYLAQQCRPYTKWDDLLVSHSAMDAMNEGASSDHFSSFFSELKLWAGTKEKKVKIVDREGYVIELPSYLDVEDVDPIEIYAYYLGLNINNLHNGIYLEYYLSFPVTYEVSVREKIVSSFKRGIRKSLPQTLLDNEKMMDRLDVHMGASEPAAYAVTGLQTYQLEPDEIGKVFYAVFDFGGGTTDFDFGVWRSSEGKKERRFDYVIEHFGAGGDRYLGGENILALMAYQVFSDNRDKLRKDNVVFTRPPETKEFAGSETLISNSREAKLNMKLLSEKLRPLWEDSLLADTFWGSLDLNLFDKDGNSLPGYSLTLDVEALMTMVRERIEKGVINFFESVRRAFSYNLAETKDVNNKVHVLLAGNASKSVILRELMDEYISAETERFIAENDLDENQAIFELYPPLGTEESYRYFQENNIDFDPEDLEKPTAKTGVAFGLIDCRKGSRIKVVDKNVKEDIEFRYYLGEVRKNKFKTYIDRKQSYNKWVDFIDAGEQFFEVFYTDQPTASTGRLNGNDPSIKKERIELDVVDDELLVYIRLVSPTAFEYVVASEEGISIGEFESDLVRVELG